MVRPLNRFASAPSTSPFLRTAIRAELLEARETPSISGSSAILASQPQQVAQPILAEQRDRYAVATEGGGVAQVNVYDAKTNALIGIINPFGNKYTGAISVATGDLNGDGVEDIVVGAGRGLTPQVKVFDGVSLHNIGTFLAYSPTFTGGVNVAVGDVNHDGRADLVTGAGIGSAPHVKVFNGTSLFATPTSTLNASVKPTQSYFAFETSFRGGINVAVGDVNHDGYGDIVVGKAAGQSPQVAAFSGKDQSVLMNVTAYSPTYTGGVSVAVGDINGDGTQEIITGMSGMGGSTVNIYNTNGLLLGQYNAFGNGYGVRVATVDVDGNGTKSIVAASGAGTAPEVKVLSGFTGVTRRDFPGFMPWFTRGLTVG